MEVFLHKDDMPKNCVGCRFSQRTGLSDYPIACCVSGNYIRESILENRHSTCLLRCVEESKEYQLLDKSISIVADCFMNTAEEDDE